MQVEGTDGGPIVVMWAGEEMLIERKRELEATGQVPLRHNSQIN